LPQKVFRIGDFRFWICGREEATEGAEKAEKGDAISDWTLRARRLPYSRQDASGTGLAGGETAKGAENAERGEAVLDLRLWIAQ